jgi:hypothetical protein
MTVTAQREEGIRMLLDASHGVEWRKREHSVVLVQFDGLVLAGETHSAYYIQSVYSIFITKFHFILI